MKEYMIDEKTGIHYTLHGDYYLPDFELPAQEPVGVWGQRHLQYLQQSHRGIYDGLLLSGKLDGYLIGLDRQADEMFRRLVATLADRDNITEQLKATDQMEWVRRMNAARAAATEIVNSELIYR